MQAQSFSPAPQGGRTPFLHETNETADEHGCPPMRGMIRAFHVHSYKGDTRDAARRLALSPAWACTIDREML